MLWSITCLLPTELAGKSAFLAAYPVPPSEIASARHAITVAGLLLFIEPSFGTAALYASVMNEEKRVGPTLDA